MKELKMRGYVTPADCGGDVQAALELAEKLDIQKVVLSGDCQWEKPLVLRGGMYLVLEDCRLNADLVTPQQENYSFRQQFITIEGKNSTLCGNIHIFNAHHIHISGLTMQGDMTFEYALWGTLEDLVFAKGNLKLGRGCGNFIVQRITGNQPAYIDGSIGCGKIVPGVKPDLQSIILQHSDFSQSETGVILGAAEDCGVLNIQADHITAKHTAVQVGTGENLPDYLFFNLTLTDLTAPNPIDYQNPVKHVYVK